MNEKNLRTPTSEEAREMQKKAVETRARNKIKNRMLKDAILESMTEEDWDKIVRGAIERAKQSDQSFTVLRDTIGQKPKDEVTLTEQTINVQIDD